jgi:hypothetical protein
MKKILTRNKTEFIWGLLVFIALLLGVYFRLKGINKWPLALDEFYLYKSVTNILTKGIPEFNAGGYYLRGILYQYISAFISLFGTNNELAARLPAVIFNLATIPAIYLLGRKLLNKKLAIIFVVLFSFSLWEIEISRFARMYTFFQMIFAWYIYFLHQYLFENNTKALKWILGLSFISIFVYEASIFIILLNFLIFLWNETSKKIEFNIRNLKKHSFSLISAIIILLLALIYILYDFRSLNAQNLLPPELSDYFENIAKQSKIRKPIILVLTSPFSLMGALMAFVLISLNSFSYKKIIKKTDLDNYAKFSVVTALLLSILNLYSVLIIIFSIFLLIEWVKISDFKKLYLSLFATILINFILQSIFAIADPNWQTLTSYRLEPGVLSSLKIIWKEFLNYPNFYELFALFRDTYKFQTLITLLLLPIGAVILISRDDKEYKAKKLFFALLGILLFIVTLINTQYFETRYFFFLYTLFLLCLLISIESISKFLFNNEAIKISFTYLILTLFVFISEDYKINHIVNIDSAEINFRKGMSKKLRDHFYPRWDSRSVAEIININAVEDELIISNEQISSFYLKRLDYLYRNYTSNDFKLESVNKGQNERWTDAKLIYKYENLKNLLNTEKTKWLFINKTYGMQEFNEMGFFDYMHQYLFYSSIDGTSFLYKLPANKITLP